MGSPTAGGGGAHPAVVSHKKGGVGEKALRYMAAVDVLPQFGLFAGSEILRAQWAGVRDRGYTLRAGVILVILNQQTGFFQGDVSAVTVEP